jgi:NADPH-dependent 2,4-dienoyl-CoA reductase/sulfur reductase-like enzyme
MPAHLRSAAFAAAVLAVAAEPDATSSTGAKFSNGTEADGGATTHVAVIGAGFAGLTAACELRKLG